MQTHLLAGWGRRAAQGFIGLLGLAFVALGLRLATATGSLPQDLARLQFERMFGVRDAFLGGLTLLFLVLRNRAALTAYLAAVLILPLADTAVLAPLLGLRAAALGNVPFEIPLLVALMLARPAAVAWG